MANYYQANDQIYREDTKSGDTVVVADFSKGDSERTFECDQLEAIRIGLAQALTEILNVLSKESNT